MRPCLAQPHDHLLLSYHGLPERHVRQADPTGGHCLCSPSCCQQPPASVLGRCYCAPCVRTSERLTAARGMPHERWSLAFRSRLDRAKRIEPHTDAVLKELAAQGVRRWLVACPACVADCIEPLEEIRIRGRDTFLAAGGEELTLIPCLNDQPQWADAVAALCRQPSDNILAA
jgi:ferrochelatase